MQVCTLPLTRADDTDLEPLPGFESAIATDESLPAATVSFVGVDGFDTLSDTEGQLTELQTKYDELNDANRQLIGERDNWKQRARNAEGDDKDEGN